MLKRTVLTALATCATLIFAASAQAAYLTLGTTNTGNAPTTLSGSTAGSELLVKNTNGASANAFGLYGLLTATAPTATAAAVRGHNGSTNARGYGVYGSQAGSGTGVYGFTPSGRGVFGSSTSGTGVYGLHSGTTTGAAAGALGQSSGFQGTGLKGIATSGSYAKGVWGVSDNGYGGYFEAPGSVGFGIYASGGEYGVSGSSASGTGVHGSSGSTDLSTAAGVLGTSGGNGVVGEGGSPFGVGVAGRAGGRYGFGILGCADYGSSYEQNCLPPAVSTHDGGTGGVFIAGSPDGPYGIGVEAISEGANGTGVHGFSPDGDGVYGQTFSGEGVRGSSPSGDGVAGFSDSGYAGYFHGDALVTNHLTIDAGCTGCTGPSALQIDDPQDPTHKYLQHSSVASSQQLDIYSGNVTTNGKGFASVTMPRWFQALNRQFRYQLTPVGHKAWGAQAIVWNGIKDNRFTIRSKPGVQISWQVTAVRHDRFAKAHPVRVVAPKSKKDQGKYVNPELYGKPKADGIGYQKPPRAPRRLTHKR